MEGLGEARVYQFSRSLYRELGPLVVEDRYGTACDNRQHFLQSCERAFQRLASDRHYFARPSRTLFNDVRFFFPIAEQMRVYRVIESYMRVATQFVDEREREGISLDGNPLSCHASTRKGTACQRVPLPGSKYCPSHKHLEESYATSAAA
jgi:hypothetical protein